MMSCARIHPFLAAYHDDMLSMAERDRVRVHVMTCVDCREILESYDALYTALRFAPSPHVPPTLARDVYARIAALNASGVGRRRGLVSGGAMRTLGGTAGVLAILTGLAAAVLQLGRPAEAPMVSAQDAASRVRAVYSAVHHAEVGQLPRSEQTAVAPVGTVLAGAPELLVKSSKVVGSKLTVYSAAVEAPDGGAPRDIIPMQMQVGRASATDGRAVVEHIVSGAPTPIATLDANAGLAYLHLDNANALRANRGNSPAQIEWRSFVAKATPEVLATPAPANGQVFTGVTADPLNHSVYYSTLAKAPLGGIYRIDTEAMSVTQVVSLGIDTAPSSTTLTTSWSPYVRQVYASSGGSLLFTVIADTSAGTSITIHATSVGSTTNVRDPWFDYVEAPDRQHIAWTVKPHVDGGFGTLTVSPMSNSVAAATTSYVVASNSAHPIWSADGSYLLYRHRGVGARSGLYVWSSRTRTSRMLVAAPVSGQLSISSDAWSPDGQYIAYVLSQPDGPGATSTVYLCNTSTGYAWRAFSRRWIGAVTWAEGPSAPRPPTKLTRQASTMSTTVSAEGARLSLSASSPMTPTSPESALQSYYAALNKHDYTAAFTMLDKADQQNFTRFVSGFADTVSDTILPARATAQRDQVGSPDFACVAFAFTAHHQDGSAVRYGGWYALRQTTEADSSKTHWRIAVSHSHIVAGGQATTPPPALCH